MNSIAAQPLQIGHPAERLTVGLRCPAFIGDTAQQLADDYYPGYAEILVRSAKHGVSRRPGGVSKP